MAQTGFTPILLYSTSTGGAAPVAGNLTNSTLGSELAINITDGKLFYKDNLGAVQVIAWKVVPTTAGGTGLTSYSQGDLIYYNSGTTFSTLAKNTNATRYLANTGTNNNPDWAQINLANGVTGTLPTGNGGTGLTTFTANGIVYASSTSALATGSALTFDGTNFATTGAATAARFIPTGTTVPANGLYLPTANTLGFAASSALQATLSANGLATTASITVGSGGTYAAGSIYSDANWGFLVRAKQASPAQAIFRFANSADVECFRVDNSNNLSLASGNLVIATSGKGIDFSATAGTGTSELLADYEEGTFTATLTAETTAPTTPVTATAYYTKIGREVTIYIEFIDVNTTGAVGVLNVTGLPFTSSASRGSVGTLMTYGLSSPNAYSVTYLAAGSTVIKQYTITDNAAWATVNITAGTTKFLYITHTYFV